MKQPMRYRIRAGLVLAVALLLTPPVLAVPPVDAAAEAEASAPAAGWADVVVDLWHRLVAAAGVPAGGKWATPEPGAEDADQLRAYEGKKDNGPSLDPNGHY